MRCVRKSILIEINPILLFLQLCAVQSSILIEINPILLSPIVCSVFYHEVWLETWERCHHYIIIHNSQSICLHTEYYIDLPNSSRIYYSPSMSSYCSTL